MRPERIETPKELPIVYTVPHASHELGSEWERRSAITSRQKKEYSDMGTKNSVPQHGKVVLGKRSRALGDLNRSRSDATLFAVETFADADGKRNPLWKKGMAPTPSEKTKLIEAHYDVFHGEIDRALKSGAQMLVDWHNMPAEYRIGSGEKIGELRKMPSVILSNNGDPHSGDISKEERKRGVNTTCDPSFIEDLAHELRGELKRQGLPHTVELNTLDGRRKNDDCGHISAHYNTRTNPGLGVTHEVQSLQVEWSRALSALPDGEAKLRRAFEAAMEKVYLQKKVKIQLRTISKRLTSPNV